MPATDTSKKWKFYDRLEREFYVHQIITPPRNRGGVIFSLQFVCVCLSVSLFVRLCLWTKFQPNGWTDLDAVFAKWLLTALARTLLKLVTLGQRSKSQWRNTYFFFIILLISLLCISALLCSINMKFGMSLRYTFGRLWRHLSFH